jgi:N-hydroxyarylamine O-acetyltransferase
LEKWYNLMVAKPDSNSRYALWNNQFTVHYLDGRTEHHVLSTVAELRATLENVFCLNLGAIAEFDRMLQQLIERSCAMT